MRKCVAIFLAATCLMASAQPSLKLQRGSALHLAFGPTSQLQAVLALRRGESTDIVIFQRGVDVVVSVRGPNGALVDEVDSPNGRNGDEPVSIYARDGGEYRLEIRPISTSEPQGMIDVRVTALRSSAETLQIREQKAKIRRAAAAWLGRNDAPLPRADRLPATASLAPVDQLAASAQVVGLGEATHGSREFGDVRAALAERLIEMHGYRVIAVEDSVSRWRELEPYVAGTTATPASPLEWGWIGRRSRRALLEWVRDWNLRHPLDPVKIVGVDPQDNATARNALQAILDRAYGEAAGKAWPQHAKELAAADEQTQVFGNSDVDSSTRNFLQDLLARLSADASLLTRRLGAKDYGQALDYTRELAAFADFNSSGGPLARSRDWYMALGVLRAVDSARPNAKTIYWGHNAHVSAAATSWGPTGALIRSALGCKYRAIATTFGQGSFLAQIPNDPSDRLQVATVPPANEDTLEAVLAEVRPGAHVSSWPCGDTANRGAAWLNEPRLMRWVGGLYAPGTAPTASFRPYRVTDAFDAIVYIPLVHAEADPGDRPIIAPRKR